MSMLGFQDEIHSPQSSTNTAWTTYDPLNIDEVLIPLGTNGDSNYNSDTDSGNNEQSWAVDDITAFEGGTLREFVVYLSFISGYSGAESVRILLDATHYNCTKIPVTYSGTRVWEAWVAYPDVSTTDGFTAPEVKVTSPTSEIRLHNLLCHSICLRNAHLLRPASLHGDDDWLTDSGIIDEPIFYGNQTFARDNSSVNETGKTSAPGTWALAYTDSIPATSNGILAFIQAFGENIAPSRIYVDNTAYSDDYIEDDYFQTGGPRTWYKTDDISSGISNMGLGVFEPNLGTGVDGDDFRAGYLVAAYDDDNYGHERLLLNGDGPSGRFYAQMSHGMDAKTDGSWPNYSYGLGNETILFDLENMPTDLDEVTGLTIFVHFAVSNVSSNNTYLSTVRLVESDQSTALTSTEDASGWTLSTAYSTYRLDFTITGNTDKSSWDGALLELDFDINGTGSDSFRIGEIELVMEYKKTISVTAYDQRIAQRHFLTTPPTEWFQWA